MNYVMDISNQIKRSKWSILGSTSAQKQNNKALLPPPPPRSKSLYRNTLKTYFRTPLHRPLLFSLLFFSTLFLVFSCKEISDDSTVTVAPRFEVLAGSTAAGLADGQGTKARFNNPNGIAITKDDTIYVTDSNASVRKITPTGLVSTITHTDAQGAAQKIGIGSITVGSDDNLYISDPTRPNIYRMVITSSTNSGIVSNFADGPTARIARPRGLAFDTSGNLYVADAILHGIRKIPASGAATDLAGGTANSGSTDGPGTTARFNTPNGIALDSAGNLYVADTGNNRIRKVITSGTNAGTVTTIAGDGTEGHKDGKGTEAKFNRPSGIIVTDDGTLYVTDTYNDSIRKITSAGVVTTLLKNLTKPAGILLSKDGTVAYVTDAHRVIKLYLDRF